MEAPNDFITWQSLLTFSGATMATVVVSNTYQRMRNRNPKWLALAVAQVICLAVVFQAHQSAAPGVATPWTDWLVAVVNGCLVFCAATGATTVGDSAQEGTLVGKSAGSPATPKREFWTRWF
jgi:FtsH-binding integral membrane protein